MAKVSYLLRRGANYYWRRRLPVGNGPARKQTHVIISLGTPLLPRARLLGARLNLIAELLTEQLPMLTSEQINGVFRSVLLAQVTKLDCVVASECADATFDLSESVRMDEQWYWVYRLLGARGPNAEVDNDVAEQMRAASVPEEDIYTVAVRLQQLRRAKMVPVPQCKLEALCKAVDAELTDGNISMTQQAYFRAKSEAAALSARNQRDGRSSDRARAEVVVAQDAKTFADLKLRKAASAAAYPEDSAQAASLHATTEESRESQQPTAPQTISFETHPIFIASEKMIADNKEHKIWREKGQLQARQTYRLFVMLLLEQKVHSIEALRQEHFSAFKDMLGQFATVYGKSSRDKTRSLEELREIGALKTAAERGVEGSTINRHLTALTSMVRTLRAEGKPIKADINPDALRVPKTERGRDLTKSASPIRVDAMFQLPVFSGCANAEEQFKAGEQIFHCANYFVPMLLHYAAGRREEFCGLRVDEVCTDGPIPFIDVVPNEYRDLKTLASQRGLPIPPEMLRLNFLPYWRAVKSLGYDLVFPELRWGDSNMSLGGRFYKNFERGLGLVRKAGGPKPDAKEQSFHFRQLRKAFGAQLKKRGVHSEERADLLGHAGGTVTEENYADVTELTRMLELMGKIPNVTSHLIPKTVQLLPWVRDHLPPPDARRRERKIRLARG
jgi:integrase